MLVLSKPAIYGLELTPACNSRCLGCSNSYADHRQPDPMAVDQWQHILDVIAPDAVQFKLTGGEPTLHPEFFRIVNMATSYDARVTIFTNARWQHPHQLVERLQDIPNLSGLLISLHGAWASSHEAFTRTRGSFDETCANVRLAVEHGIPVMMSTIITRYSCDELEAVQVLANNLGATGVAFNRYLGPESTEVEAAPESLKMAMNRVEAMIEDGLSVGHGIGVPQCFIHNHSEGCLAGVASASIDPWGNMRPCAHSPTIIGSLLDRSIEDVWTSDRFDQWRGILPDDCAACAALAHCHGGCRALVEIRVSHRDPLRGEALTEYPVTVTTQMLPITGRPRLKARFRQETFGYVLLGEGQAIPIHADAHPVLLACDGQMTLGELAAQFGSPALDLIGELWQIGLIHIANTE